jgi:murein DD-endopeptidase MepM/ murein hydrolase activator NlpD
VEAFGKLCPPRPGDLRPILFDSFFSPRGNQVHKAIDITAAPGSLVISPVNGRVLESWTFQGEQRPGAGFSERGGWYVRLRDENGFIHYFAHLARRPRVRSGQRVRAGQILGEVGRTGAAAPTCPHLHYSITSPGGSKINPFPELQPLWLAGDWKRRAPTPGQLFGIAALAGLSWWGFRVLRRRA